MQKASAEMSEKIEIAARAAMRGQKRAMFAMSKQLGLKRKADNDADDRMSDDEPTDLGGSSASIGTTSEGFDFPEDPIAAKRKKDNSPSPARGFIIQTHRGPGSEIGQPRTAPTTKDLLEALPTVPVHQWSEPLPPIQEHTAEGGSEQQTEEVKAEDKKSEDDLIIVNEATSSTSYGKAQAKAGVAATNAPYEPKGSGESS